MDRFMATVVRSRQLLLFLLVVAAVAMVAPRPVVAADGAGAPTIGLLPNCTTTCGGVSVPYPFGISPGCHLQGFGLTCDTSREPPRLLLGDGTLQVSDISLVNSTVRVLGPEIGVTGSVVAGETARGTWGGEAWGLVDDGPYRLSPEHNEFVLKGCYVFAELLTRWKDTFMVINGCGSVCSGELEPPPQTDRRCPRKCSGIHQCCQAPVPQGFRSYDVRMKLFNYEMSLLGKGNYSDDTFSVLIAEEGWFDFEQQIPPGPEATAVIPAVLQWWVPSDALLGNKTRDGRATCPRDLGSTTCHSSFSLCQVVDSEYSWRDGYTCKCQDGYQGNPYLADGCQDIDECKLSDKCYGTCTNKPGTYLCQCPPGTQGDARIPNGCVKPHDGDGSHAGRITGLGVGIGALLLCLVLGTMFLIEKLKVQREKRQRQRFFRQNRGQLLQQLVSQKADIAERMIITLEELEKATNYFDKTRELGGGGHGTVYKGILSSLHVVAIKRSKIVVQREINEFINEVAILSQVNHRNIVKLFGCCLETEVPLLVYEFISNGTLYNHLHIEASISLPWRDRLRIAVEVARAITYLHSFASMPIIHRDIKSPNILLDDNLAVKLSDFGASRYIPIDQTGVHTAVQGTLGYLDPMYHCTGHLTEKSDVYSFGVLLIELLTRKKPVSYRSSEGCGLVEHFVSIVSKGTLVQVLDPQVAKEGDGEVIDIALLAAICVKFRSAERPTMRQVEMTLESIQASKEYVSSDMTDDDRAEQTLFWVNNLSTEGRNNEPIEEYGKSSLEEECCPHAIIESHQT